LRLYNQGSWTANMGIIPKMGEEVHSTNAMSKNGEKIHKEKGRERLGKSGTPSLQNLPGGERKGGGKAARQESGKVMDDILTLVGPRDISPGKL